MLSQGLAGQSEIIFGECEVAINIDILCIYFVEYMNTFLLNVYTQRNSLVSLFLYCRRRLTKFASANEFNKLQTP